jgi:hypothetical protein
MRWTVLIFAACLLVATCVQARADMFDGQPVFGTFSKAYLDRQQLKKWKQLCKGGGRYQAMSEAYSAGKPDPCK